MTIFKGLVQQSPATSVNQEGTQNANLPTAGQKAALPGTSGTAPSGSNKYVDNADSRLTGKFVEVVAAATGNLTAAQCSNTQIMNLGQTEANVQTLPICVAGLCGKVMIATAGMGAFSMDMQAADKAYIDGTALADGNKVTLATPALGDCFIFEAWQTAAGEYNWYFTSIKGVLTDGGA